MAWLPSRKTAPPYRRSDLRWKREGRVHLILASLHERGNAPGKPRQERLVSLQHLVEHHLGGLDRGNERIGQQCLHHECRMSGEGGVDGPVVMRRGGGGDGGHAVGRGGRRGAVGSASVERTGNLDG